MDKEIKNLREQIDNININILELLNERAALVNQVRQCKNEAGLEYFDPKREREMLEHVYKSNKGPMTDDMVNEIFSTIFKISLSHMNINKDSRLLVHTGSDTSFRSIHEMFGLPPAEPVIIAGPCAIEDYESMEEAAVFLKSRGIKLMRGGAYKPRTSPYDFQGLGEKGLEILHDIGKKHGLITVTEVIDTRDVEKVAQYADVLQIGARNMQNFALLKMAGQTDKPILLKRGISATMTEFMYAAEYIALQGNRKIILCERGIRTYEQKTRNTLDISCVPILKSETSLPVIVDISHSTGRRDIVRQIAKAVLAVGADGIMVEVHPRPELARSDSNQQLSLREFGELLEHIGK